MASPSDDTTTWTEIAKQLLHRCGNTMASEAERRYRLEQLGSLVVRFPNMAAANRLADSPVRWVSKALMQPNMSYDPETEFILTIMVVDTFRHARVPYSYARALGVPGSTYLKQLRCDECLERLSPASRTLCKGCLTATYCGEACREKARSRHHGEECEMLSRGLLQTTEEYSDRYWGGAHLL